MKQATALSLRKAAHLIVQHLLLGRMMHIQGAVEGNTPRTIIYVTQGRHCHAGDLIDLGDDHGSSIIFDEVWRSDKMLAFRKLANAQCKNQIEEPTERLSWREDNQFCVIERVKKKPAKRACQKK